MTANDRTGAGRVLVCGGRYFDDYSFLASELDSLSPSVVIHGGARGADTLAHRWAQNHCVPIERYPADWDRYGRAAGPIRNVEMLAKSQPDVVLAFPGGDGTAHMVKIARALGVKVTIAQATGGHHDL